MTSDDRPDVVLTTGRASTPASEYRVWVFPQGSDGQLGSPDSFSHFRAVAGSVAIGDVSGDDREEIALGLEDHGLQVWPQVPPGVAVWPMPHQIENGGLLRLGRLNDDNLLDVAAVGFGTNSVSVMLSSTGGPNPPVEYPVLHGGREISRSRTSPATDATT
ncbi:MAG: hypothetical protein H0U05_09805 [Actinobacteria bacterium]|nr:hypothetical protein [Actinomycetota bacterium]